MATYTVQLGETEFCDDCGRKIQAGEKRHEYQGKSLCPRCVEIVWAYELEAEEVERAHYVDTCPGQPKVHIGSGTGEWTI